MTPAKRFKKYLVERDIKLSHAEKAMGASNGLLGKIFETGKGFSTDTIEKILKTYPDITYEWLIYGKSEETKEPVVSYKKKGIPVYDSDFTGGDVAQFSDEPARIVGHIDLNGFRKCIAFVHVKGSSMHPQLTPGDLIGLEPIPDFSIIEYGQPFAIETKNEQRMVKIIRKGKDDKNLILRSVNEKFDDILIHRDQINKLYKVHGPVRDPWQ